jgi:succinate dehydrogenase hydrophobic anchor subunit
MLRVAATRSAVLATRSGTRNFSANAKFVEADIGPLGTRVHHTMTVFLAVATPAFFAVPDSWTDGFLNKTFGLVLSANIAAHSWIGLNYVASDYVPKFSKKALGPSRVFSAALCGVMFLGLVKINFGSKGGIKGVVKGLWNPPQQEEKK